MPNAVSISSAQVLLIGLGGLGCPATATLLAAGVRRLTLVDPDRVELTNLHRQPWYRTGDLGALKVEVAARRIARLHPDAQLNPLATRVGAGEAAKLVASHDLTVDGTDDRDTKLLLSDASVRTGRPVIYGGVVQLQGQVLALQRGGPCLRCLFEDGVDAGPSCAQAGVLGAMAGFVGALQGGVALAALAGQEPKGRLRVVDGASLRVREVQLRRAEDCMACRSLAA